jgi:1-acyl-sn-glycerol-3-phosphate acyltransferase
MLKLIGKLILFLGGWKIIDNTPNGVNSYKKAVMIAAPHTSNWDYVYAMAMLYSKGLPIKYLGKESLFKFPLGIIIRGLGGIPVNRSQRNNLVEEMGKMLKNSTEDIQLIIPAEGTRHYTKEWKSGFYHIASQAEVPIILGYLDFKKKIGGFLTVFYPTGDYEKDLVEIKSYYQGITPKIPENNSLK